MISAKEAARRKQRIKDAAYQLFKEKGVESVTYGDIARISKISESSIYHYYAQKSLILMDTYKSLWEEIEEELKKATIQTEQFCNACGLRQVAYLIDAFEGVYTNHGSYLKFALECKLYWNRQSLAVNSEDFDAITAPILQQFAAAIRKGLEDQTVHLHADFESCCFLLWSVLRSYMEQIAILDGFYVGDNRYKANFHTLKEHVLKLLS